MGSNEKIRRNAICPKCESGKKYKHCCGHHSKQQTEPNQAHIQHLINREKANELRRQQQQGRGRPIISTNIKDQKIVAVGNVIHYSGSWKTFTDFLIDYVKIAFARDGADWGTEELKKPEEERHPIVQWYHKLCDLQRKNFDPTKEIQYSTLTNAATCYLGLAYNLYLLHHNLELQYILIKRLKDIHNFQGAYYELIVAGCLIRAGFELELEDEANVEFKHCEFSAVSLTTGKKYWVEAKARSVAGILGKKNGAKKNDPTSRLSNHIREAFKKPAADERLIFVDVNTPIELRTKPEWIEKAGKKLDQMERDTPDEKKAYIFVTNMGFHWHPDAPKDFHAMIVYGFHIPDFSKPGNFRFSDFYRMKKKHVDAHKIIEAFQKYPAIPNTFDGELSSCSYGMEDAPPLIGERCVFEDGSGSEMEAVVTAAMVNEDDWKIYVGLDNGQILTKEMSELQIQDYKEHPETFFGVIHRPGKDFEQEDEYGFFEHMVEIHMDYDRNHLLDLMTNCPDQEALRVLSHEDLVLTYCEGLIESIKRMQDNPA